MCVDLTCAVFIISSCVINQYQHDVDLKPIVLNRRHIAVYININTVRIVHTPHSVINPPVLNSNTFLECSYISANQIILINRVFWKEKIRWVRIIQGIVLRLHHSSDTFRACQTSSSRFFLWKRRIARTGTRCGIKPNLFKGSRMSVGPWRSFGRRTP